MDNMLILSSSTQLLPQTCILLYVYNAATVLCHILYSPPGGAIAQKTAPNVLSICLFKSPLAYFDLFCCGRVSQVCLY